jgi:ParB-like chromosome segregation protein Spo0J
MTSPSTAQNVEQWPIQRLVEYPRNPRKNDGAVDRMCGSIREFGFKIPCLFRSDGEIVDGHLRLKAARKLGISEVPVARRRGEGERHAAATRNSGVPHW